MTLLLICDYFPPSFAPRMGFLCKYLKEFGWKILVVAFENEIRGDMGIITGYADTVLIIPRRKRNPYNLLRLTSPFLPYNYTHNEKRLEKLAWELAQAEHPDVVLTSICSEVSPAFSASHLAKRLAIPLVVDVRDLYEQNARLHITKMPISELRHALWPYLLRFRRYFRNFVLRRASAVTTVSEWHAHFLRKYNSNIHLIFNGYDPNLFFQRLPRQKAKFEIYYTGGLGFAGDCDPTLFLQAIADLDSKSIISPKNFSTVFYSGGKPKNRPDILKMISELNLESYVKFRPYVPLQEVPLILQSASILLLLCNKSAPDGPHGIMTTKLFEYLAMNRPILCVRSDEDCIEKTINEMHAGLAARTLEETIDFIHARYMEWQEFGFTTGHTDMEKVERLFSRKRQADQFAKLIEDVVASHNREDRCFALRSKRD